MRCTALLLLSAIALVRGDEIRIRNAEPFQGRLLDLRGAVARVWPVWSLDPVEIPLARLEQWSREERVPGVGEETPANLRVRLRNGDILYLRFEEIDRDWIRGTTTWGEPVALRRTMVSVLEWMPDAERIRLDDVGRGEEWEPLQGASPRKIASSLHFPPGAMGMYFRELPPFPPKFLLEIRLRLVEGDPIFGLGVSTPQAVGGEGLFSLRSHRESIFVLENMGGRGRFGAQPTRTLPPLKERVMDLRLYGDKEANTFALWINGDRALRWKLTKADIDQAFKGGGMVLNCQTGASLVLEELRLVAGVPAPEDAEALRPCPDRYRFLLRNGDQMEGQLLRGGKERLFLASAELGEIPLRVRSVDRIAFPEDGGRLPRRMARDVELRCSSTGDKLTLSMDSFDGEAFVGSSEMLEKPLRIPRDRVDLLRFNLYSSGGREVVGTWTLLGEAR